MKMRASRWLSIPFLLFLFSFQGQAQQTLQHLHSHVRPAVARGQAKPLHAMDAAQRLNLSIVLPLRNQAQLKNLLSRITDPSSPDYRHFLNVTEFADQFGPSIQDYQGILDFAKANGFTVNGHLDNRLVVPISGTVDQIQRVFNVTMKVYQHPTENRTFFSPDREPSMATKIPIAHISGLNNFSIPVSMAIKGPAERSLASTSVQGSGPGGSYLGSDIRAAYYTNGSLTGSGQTIALVQFDGYEIGDVIASFDGTATSAPNGSNYLLTYKPTAGGGPYTIPINNVLLDGATGAPQSGEDAEEVLDIVQAVSMAPGLSQVRVYIGANDADILGAVASENLANELSISWAWTPDDPSVVDQFFEEMAAQGQSVFAASGDYGAYSPTFTYYFPGEDDWVTAVGGTTLTTSGPGGSLVAETAWDQSGGGISPDGILIPTWQAGVASSSNGASNTLRNVPDLAMEADFDNYSCNMGSCSGGWAGTSFASPRWAAFTALINEQAQIAGTARVGFINPWLYSTGQSSTYGSEFHDIDSGQNDYESGYGFYVVPGYDLVTGWGSPAGQNLIDALAPRSASGFQLSTSQSSLTINPGSSATTTIGVTYRGGFSGSVSLAVTSALPTGFTASFDTNPTTGTSVLTIDSSIFAATQSYVVTITGTSGALQATTYVTVNTPTNAVVLVSPTVPVVPVTAAVFKPGALVPVNGTIVGSPQAFYLRWAAGINAVSGWTSQGITQSPTLTPPFSNATVGTWDTTSITTAGYYTIQLSAEYTEGTVSATTLVYLEPDLISANWPKWIDLTPDTYSGIVPIDYANGNTGLAIVEPQYLNTSNPPRYRVFSPDGSSDLSTDLYFGTYLSPAFGHLNPGDAGESLLADAGSIVDIDTTGIESSLPLNGANVDFQLTQVVLADLKGDSTLATIAYAIQNWNKIAFIYAWDSNKQILNANFPIQIPYQNTNSMFSWNQGIAVGDIDGDGKQEIIAFESTSPTTFTFALFGNDGTPRSWGAPVFDGTPGQMILVDLDGNGKLELVIAVCPPNVNYGMLHVLEPDGTERAGWPVETRSGMPFLAAGDLARTGNEQIVVAAFDVLSVLNGDGTSFSAAWPLTTNTFSPLGAPAIADIDGDGYPEILVANGNYSFPQASGKVTTISASVSPSSRTIRIPSRVQVDATGPDSTAAYFSPVLQAFHRDGKVVRSWHIPGMHGEQPFYMPRLAVGDFNHNGITDIAIVTGLISGGTPDGWISEGMIEVLSTGSPFHPLANDWPLLYHDAYNSAVAFPFVTKSPGAAPPTFSVPSGTYTSTQTVSISDSTPGYVIYYTTDGTTPTTSSIPYSEPITVSATETIEAIAAANGYSQSGVSAAVYTITLPTAAPVFSPAQGTYASTQTVSITDSTPGNMIYYTTNGTTPTTNSISYSGPITVSATETIKAIATANGNSQSAVSSAVYTITSPVQPSPTVSSISPAFIDAGSARFTLTVTGSEFTSTSMVYWGTSALATEYVSATQLTAQVPASSVANAGVNSVSVQNPDAGGSTSNTLKFEVDSATASTSSPRFATTTATVSAGSAAAYPVTLPASSTSVSSTCLNLPANATCSYSPTTGAVTIATKSSTPDGDYQITVVFTETIPGASTAWLLFPILLLPLAAIRKRGAWKAWLAACVLLGLIMTGFASGCGGNSNGGISTPTPAPTHQVTSSGVVSMTVK